MKGLVRAIEVGGVVRIRSEELDRLMAENESGPSSRVADIVSDIAQVMRSPR